MPDIHGKQLPNYPPSTLVGKRGRDLGTMLAALNRVSSPRGVQLGPMGPQLVPNGTTVRFGMTGSGGIPARGGGSMTSGEVEEYSLNFSSDTTISFADSGVAFDGYNLSSQAVAANTFTIFFLLWGFWVCIWEDCP